MQNYNAPNNSFESVPAQVQETQTLTSTQALDQFKRETTRLTYQKSLEGKEKLTNPNNSLTTIFSNEEGNNDGTKISFCIGGFLGDSCGSEREQREANPDYGRYEERGITQESLSYACRKGLHYYELNKPFYVGDVHWFEGNVSCYKDQDQSTNAQSVIQTQGYLMNLNEACENELPREYGWQDVTYNNVTKSCWGTQNPRY